MPDRIQRNRTTGEYRIQTKMGWEPYTPMPEGTPERYLPGLADTPTSAFLNELGRTGKEAAIGVARSPLDVVKGLYGLITSPIESARNIGTAVTHPSDALKVLADNPREAGSALGQLLLTGKFGPKIPGMARRAPEAISTTGRGVERVGTTLANRTIGGMDLPTASALGVLTGHPEALALPMVPYTLKYGGKGLQKVGGGLERLKEALSAPTTTPSPTYPIGRSTRYRKAPKSSARVSHEVPYRAEASASPRRGRLLEQLQSDVTPAWWERVRAKN